MSSHGTNKDTSTAAPAQTANATKRTHRRTRTWSFEKDPTPKDAASAKTTKEQQQHRRGLSTSIAPATAAAANGPTSTTKALLVSIVAPRKFKPAAVVVPDTDDKDDADDDEKSVCTVATTAAEEQLLDVISVATAPSQTKKKRESIEELFDSPKAASSKSLTSANEENDKLNSKDAEKKEKLSIEELFDEPLSQQPNSVTGTKAGSDGTTASSDPSASAMKKNTVMPIEELFEPAANASSAGVSDSIRSTLTTSTHSSDHGDVEGGKTIRSSTRSDTSGGSAQRPAGGDGKPPLPPAPPSLPVFHQLDATETVKRSNKVPSSAAAGVTPATLNSSNNVLPPTNDERVMALADDFLDAIWKDQQSISEGGQETEATAYVPLDKIQQPAATGEGGANDPDEEAGSKEKEEVPKEEEDEEEEKVTPEEAAAVKVGEDPEDAEINVEELLRIAFQTLLEEWHLLNVPTYSMMLDKQQQQLPPPTQPQVFGMENSLVANTNAAPIKEPKSWIHVQVMARPSSMGVIMERLERIGVGTEVGTVSFFKAELCRTASPYAHMPVAPPALAAADSTTAETATSDRSTAAGQNGILTRSITYSQATATDSEDEEADASRRAEQERLKAEQERLKQERMLEDARNEWKNAATRLRIEQVREQIAEQAALSFDFIALLTVASILAGVGLITDNTVVIVASMLVSPIMGPVLGLTFGSRVKDWPLVKASFLNEILALLGCIVVGALIGLPCSAVNDLTQDWPTNEMEIRGDSRGLLTGIAIAIPSGMGVCLSILGGNTSSLVGVAISASLLPPAVNCGICLAYAFLLGVGAVDSVPGEDGMERGAESYLEIGGISLALTVLNIVCIWIAGQVMFEIKEVAPAVQKNAFWATDIKMARKFNQEKPAPVNVSILRKGVATALSQQQQESDSKKKEPIGPVRIRIPKPERKRTTFSSLDDALTLRPKAKSEQVGHKVWSAAISEEIQQEEQGKEEDDENVRYVGLEDMANLLGFHDEDDDEDEVEPQSVRNSSRRPSGSRTWIF